MSSMAMDGSRVLLSTAMFQTTSVTGSPAAAAETIIATLVLPVGIRAEQRVFLIGWGTWTVGTSGTSSRVRLRQTNVAGTTVADSGLLNSAAGVVFGPSIIGVDQPGAQNNFTYVMTLTIAAGAAASTVSAVGLVALIV